MFPQITQNLLDFFMLEKCEELEWWKQSGINISVHESYKTK